jgi:hypothetical protein
MGFLPNRRAVALLLLASLAPANAADLAMSKSTWHRLAALQVGETSVIDRFPIGPSLDTTMRLERVEIYAPDAHIYFMTASGQQEIPRSKLIFLRGSASDGSADVAVALNADGSFSSADGEGPQGEFVLNDRVNPAGTHTLSAKSREATLPKNFKLDFRCSNDQEDLHAKSTDDLASQLKIATTPAPAPAVATHALRFATIAIDTDTAFMSNLFSNNTTNATNWIAKMVNNMNLMYERDLLVQLYLGTTILRTNPATDPYAAGHSNPTTDVPADGTDLNNFGNYWAANEAGVSRSFAVLLSGLGPCSGGGCSASGIAWINAYCQKPSSGGSYAVVQVFSSLAIDPNGSAAAGLYDHELGHNFGADHTHCTNVTNGQWAVATNTIDTCYNGESGAGCYGGATTTCPASGAGTIMSYCNVKGCGSNLKAFHTTQIIAAAPWGLLSRITAAPAGCLSTSDDIFFDTFEKPGG